MAARRILVLFVALMGIGVLASALAPRNPGSGPSTTPTVTTPETQTIGGVGGSSRLVQGRLDAPASQPDERRPKVVRAREGDRVVLTVRADFDDQIVVSGYDLQEPVSELVPAHFDFFADQPGRFEVRTLDRATVAGRLLVTPPSEEAGGGQP